MVLLIFLLLYFFYLPPFILWKTENKVEITGKGISIENFLDSVAIQQYLIFLILFVIAFSFIYLICIINFGKHLVEVLVFNCHQIIAKAAVAC